jgi:hypothetical protein
VIQTALCPAHVGMGQGDVEKDLLKENEEEKRAIITDI